MHLKWSILAGEDAEEGRGGAAGAGGGACAGRTRRALNDSLRIAGRMLNFWHEKCILSKKSLEFVKN